MGDIEFAYWLQGHFELMDRDKFEPFTIKQVDIIREHHKLVKQDDPDSPFLNLMEGLLEGFAMIDSSCEDQNHGDIFDMRLWITDRIKEKVQEQFKKVTSDFALPDIVDALNPLVPNPFINPHQTCNRVGSGTVFC